MPRIRMKFPGSDLTSPQIAFLSGMLGFGLVAHIHSFYYVKVFLNHYQISQTGFQISQVVYLIWNALNDPLFAYIQDNAKYACVRTRRHALLYGAPFWGLSFLVFWFPWESAGHATWITGVHLTVSLVLYDAVFSFNGLAMCALFTEISPRHEDRVLLTRWTAAVGIIPATSIFIIEEFSNSLTNFKNFQILCVLLAIAAVVLTLYAGCYALTESECLGDTRQDQMKEQSLDSIWRLTWNILINRNFVAFVIGNFFQNFHGTFLSNFMAIFAENLISTSLVSRQIRSMCYSGRSLLGIGVIVLGAPILTSLGYHRVVRYSFSAKIALAIFLYAFGWQFRSVILVVMVIDSVFYLFSSSTFNLAMADIAEDDQRKYNRRIPNTSMVFGTNALVIKPAQSLAPMMTTAILEAYGYGHLKDGTLKGAELDSLHMTMFTLICLVPGLIGIIQHVSWSYYQLRNTHKSQISDFDASKNLILT